MQMLLVSTASTADCEMLSCPGTGFLAAMAGLDLQQDGICQQGCHMCLASDFTRQHQWSVLHSIEHAQIQEQGGC